MVTVVDAKHIQQHWSANEAQEQIAFADVILLNKTDLVGPEELDELESKIRAMNGMTKIYRTQNSEVSMESLLGVQAFDLDRALEISPEFLKGTTPQHDWTVNSFAIVESGELDGEKLNSWLNNLIETKGEDLFRMKGLLNIAGEEERFVFQGVHMLFDGKPDRLWREGENRKNELVFIGRNLDQAQMRKDFKQCLV